MHFSTNRRTNNYSVLKLMRIFKEVKYNSEGMEFSRVLSRHVVSSNLVSSKSEDQVIEKRRLPIWCSIWYHLKIAPRWDHCYGFAYLRISSLCSEEASSSIGKYIQYSEVHRNVQQQLIAHWCARYIYRECNEQ